MGYLSFLLREKTNNRDLPVNSPANRIGTIEFPISNEKRGKQDGPQPKPEKHLTNNAIFRKMKIALNLKSEEILTILAQANFRISKHELSAFFRKPDHINTTENAKTKSCVTC